MKLALAAFAFALAIASQAPAGDAVPEPSGYRGEPYRAPVPASLEHARVVSPTEAHDLWKDGAAIFVDVLPQALRPANLPEGTIWRDKPRFSIPGAIWLPNTGYQQIAEETAQYLWQGIEQARRGREELPLVFFCLSECWMSWNVAKRALEHGYGQVFWLPSGSDGWEAAGYPTEAVKPFEPR